MKNWTEHYIKQDTFGSWGGYGAQGPKGEIGEEILSLKEEHIHGLIDKIEALKKEYHKLGWVFNYRKIKRTLDQITNHQTHYPEFYL